MANPTYQSWLPSCAYIADLPVYLSFKGIKSGNPEQAIAGALCGFFAVPLSVALTPLTIVADVIVGVVETLFVLFAGYGVKEAMNLGLKKIILSPLHQLLAMVTKIVVFAIPILWSLSYEASIGIIKMLPNSINHTKFSIFIDPNITEIKPATA